MLIRINLIVLNSSPMFLVLSPDSKMVRNIKMGWKLTKLWKILGAPKNNTDTSHGISVFSYGEYPTEFLCIDCLVPYMGTFLCFRYKTIVLTLWTKSDISCKNTFDVWKQKYFWNLQIWPPFFSMLWPVGAWNPSPT